MNYRVVTHVMVPSLQRERDVIRSVQVRTRDDTAILQDLPRGRNIVGKSFPAPPTFDALAYFTLSWRVTSRGTLDASVNGIIPLRYDDRTKNTTADVIVVRLLAYKAAYADDSSDDPSGRTHITLQPYKFVTDRAGKETLFFSDLYFDNATSLPTRVRYTGPDAKEFVVDYATVEGHWVISRLHYEETLFAPLSVARLHVRADAVYDSYAFPALAPDPRLAG